MDVGFTGFRQCARSPEVRHLVQRQPGKEAGGSLHDELGVLLVLTAEGKSKRGGQARPSLSAPAPIEYCRQENKQLRKHSRDGESNR